MLLNAESFPLTKDARASSVIVECGAYSISYTGDYMDYVNRDVNQNAWEEQNGGLCLYKVQVTWGNVNTAKKESGDTKYMGAVCCTD